MFPVGVADQAAGARRRRGGSALPVADKPDSQEICFVPDGDYAAFVAAGSPRSHAAARSSTRRATRSARTAASTASRSASARGSAIASPTPLYVLRIDAESRERHRRSARRRSSDTR